MRKVKPYKQWLLEQGESDTLDVISASPLDQYISPLDEQLSSRLRAEGESRFGLSEDLIEEEETDEDLDIMSQFTEEQPSSLAQPGIQGFGEIKYYKGQPVLQVQ